MKTQIISLILIISMIGLSSASYLTIEPNIITFSGFPGENFTRVINLTTSHNSTVYLNHSLNNNILLQMVDSVYVNTFNQVEINFSIKTDAEIGNYTILIMGNATLPDNVVSTGNGGGGSSSGGSCLTEWECSGWSDCIPYDNLTGYQTRDCKKKIPYCYVKDKVQITQICELKQNNQTIENNTEIKDNKDIFFNKNSNRILIILALTLSSIAFFFLIKHLILNSLQDKKEVNSF